MVAVQFCPFVWIILNAHSSFFLHIRSPGSACKRVHINVYMQQWLNRHTVFRKGFPAVNRLLAAANNGYGSVYLTVIIMALNALNMYIKFYMQVCRWRWLFPERQLSSKPNLGHWTCVEPYAHCYQTTAFIPCWYTENTKVYYVCRSLLCAYSAPVYCSSARVVPWATGLSAYNCEDSIHIEVHPCSGNIIINIIIIAMITK